MNEPQAGYSITIEMAMDITDGWDANSHIYDYGDELDEYTNNGQWLSDSRDYGARVGVLGGNGYYPFAPHILGSVVSNRFVEYRGTADMGRHHRWQVETVPDNGGNWSYYTEPWGVSRPATGFRFGGLANCPIPECMPSGVYRYSYNRIGNVLQDNDSGQNRESRRIKMIWKSVKTHDAGCILKYIIVDRRSFPIEVDFGNISKMGAFRRLIGDGDKKIWNIKLASNILDVTHITGGLCNNSIEVLLCQ